MGPDFDVESSIFGRRSNPKVTKGKSKMQAAAAAHAGSAPPSSASSARGTTPLSYVSMAIDPPRSSPTPASQSRPQDAFIERFRSHISSVSINPTEPSTAAFFACLAEEVLRFTLTVLKSPTLKDCPLPPGMCGTSSFEFALTQVIALAGPPPPEPPPTPTPTTTKAACPCPLEVKTTVTPQKSKKARLLNPALPPTYTASAKHAPAKAVAAPCKGNKPKVTGVTVPPLVRPPPVVPTTTSSSSWRHQRRKGKHTTHGPSHHGIKLIPPAGSSIRASAITPDILREVNSHLKSDVKSDVVLESTSDISGGIFIAASKVPTPADVACALKHVRRLVPITGAVPIKADPATSTSSKVINAPHISCAPHLALALVLRGWTFQIPLLAAMLATS
jgi:hypothetical protein